MSEAVSPAMRGLIGRELDRIAQDERVTILLAAESGSRAWGFHSFDSDYDVRFVYLRPAEWHLRLDERRDVIERPISGELDLSGWDLGKALRLALKSNAVLPEWLQSPIRYADRPEASAALAGFCHRALTRRPVTWHYISLADRQASRMRVDGRVRLKRYFYVLRPVLAPRWMRLHDSAMPPMNLWDLIAATDLPAGVVDYIRGLVATKLGSGEMGWAADTDPQADDLIATELGAAQDWLAGERDQHRPDLWAEANTLHIDLTKRFAP